MQPADAILLRAAADIDRGVVRRVATEGAALTLDDAVLEHVAEARRGCLAALDRGERVYGVSTGMGFQAGVDLDADVQRHHQRQLLLGRAVGGPPYLDADDARAVVVARLTNLLSGHAGVSVELCQVLVDWLNDGYAPAVPAGGVGTAGEVQPLGHAFQALLGVGRVLGPDGAVVDAERALADRGAEPYSPGPKEGIALLAGAPAAAGLGALTVERVGRLITSMEIVAAASLDAAGAPGDVHGERPGELAGDPLLAEALRALRRLRGHERDPASAGHQAPVSFRVTPVVHTHLRRTLDRFTDDVDVALAAVTDSPALIDGTFVPTAGFHAVEVAAGFDALRAALVRAAELASQRTHRLLETRVTGLPAQLAAGPGSAGMVVVHKRAVAATAELRRLAAPVSVGLADTSLGQEDAQTFTFAAAAALRRAEALAAEVTACELACVIQAWWLRSSAPPPLLADALRAARELLAPVADDRPLGDELDHLSRMVAAGLDSEVRSGGASGDGGRSR